MRAGQGEAPIPGAVVGVALEALLRHGLPPPVAVDGLAPPARLMPLAEGFVERARLAAEARPEDAAVGQEGGEGVLLGAVARRGRDHLLRGPHAVAAPVETAAHA